MPLESSSTEKPRGRSGCKRLRGAIRRNQGSTDTQPGAPHGVPPRHAVSFPCVRPGAITLHTIERLQRLMRANTPPKTGDGFVKERKTLELINQIDEADVRLPKHTKQRLDYLRQIIIAGREITTAQRIEVSGLWDKYIT